MVIQKFLYNKHFDNDIQKKEWNPRKASQYSIDIYSILAFDLEQERKKKIPSRGGRNITVATGPVERRLSVRTVLTILCLVCCHKNDIHHILMIIDFTIMHWNSLELRTTVTNIAYMEFNQNRYIPGNSVNVNAQHHILMPGI